MKSLLALSLIALGISSAARGQIVSGGPRAVPDDSAGFASALQANQEAGTAIGNSAPFSLTALAAPRTSLAALSFASPSSNSSFSSAPAPAALPADPEPASPPSYRYTERDYHLEIALGVAVVRFRSSVYYATGVGTNTAVAYFLKDWLAVEGAVTTAFAPSVFAGENIKYLGYGGGPKISLGRSRFEPWFHLLAGGIHMVPQTGLSGKNGFEITAGGGVDYGLNPRVSLRLEGDYLRSHIFGQWQNSAQGIATVVFHF
jgi:opacity protein-like surface antigen